MTRSPVRVAFLPVYQNPYQHLLSAALRAENVEVLHLDSLPTVSWLRRHRGEVDILHLHWLHGLYMRRWLTPLSWLAFLARFSLARRLGYHLVWTAHNIVPHSMPFPAIHLSVRRLVMARADAVIAHCEHARTELLRRFPRPAPVDVIDHGNYDGVHPPGPGRGAARRELDLADDALVFLMLGNIAPYKGIETVVRAVLDGDDSRTVVLVAGRNRHPGLVRSLETVASVDPRVRVDADFVPDDQVPVYLNASDVAVFAFHRILSSGSVILALTHGVPVIAPAIGCIPELVGSEAGILYDPERPEALAAAMAEIRRRDLDAMGRAARGIADRLVWRDIAASTAAVYRRCVGAS